VKVAVTQENVEKLVVRVGGGVFVDETVFATG
jgi:hypothetical protein